MEARRNEARASLARYPIGGPLALTLGGTAVGGARFFIGVALWVVAEYPDEEVQQRELSAVAMFAPGFAGVALRARF